MPPQYQQVYVGLAPETIEALDDLAKEQNRDRSEIIREFVNDGLEDHG